MQSNSHVLKNKSPRRKYNYDEYKERKCDKSKSKRRVRHRQEGTALARIMLALAVVSMVLLTTACAPPHVPIPAGQDVIVFNQTGEGFCAEGTGLMSGYHYHVLVVEVAPGFWEPREVACKDVLVADCGDLFRTQGY